MTTSEYRHKEIKRVTIIGIITNTIFGILKIIFGLFSNSQAIIADGFHSFSDTVTDFLVLFISRQSNKVADEDHPYGHQRFETVGSAIIGIILLSVAAIIFWENLKILISGQFIKNFNYIILSITAISIIAKEFLFYITLSIGKKYNSKMVIANAWHTRSDSLSSIAVLIGVICNYYDILWMDNIAAIIVAFILGYVAVGILKSSIIVLTDSQINKDQLEIIKKTIAEAPEIIDYHNLRTRYMGDKILVDVNVQVSPRITVSEGHEIALRLMNTLLQSSLDILDVLVHVDIEDDDTNSNYSKLPLRKELSLIIFEKMPPLFKEKITDITLNYLSDKIYISIMVNYSERDETDDNIITSLRNDLSSYRWFGDIELNYIKKNQETFTI